MRETYLDDNLLLHIKRDEHNEYMNAYHEVMEMALCCNHDIRALVGCGTTDAFYYFMKYVTKIQNETEGIEDIMMACYLRRAEKEEEAKERCEPLTRISAGVLDLIPWLLHCPNNRKYLLPRAYYI